MNYVIEAIALLTAVFLFFRYRSSSSIDGQVKGQEIKREDLQKTLSDLYLGLKSIQEKKKKAEEQVKKVSSPEEIERFYEKELGQSANSSGKTSNADSNSTAGSSGNISSS